MLQRQVTQTELPKRPRHATLVINVLLTVILKKKVLLPTKEHIQRSHINAEIMLFLSQFLKI